MIEISAARVNGGLDALFHEAWLVLVWRLCSIKPGVEALPDEAWVDDDMDPALLDEAWVDGCVEAWPNTT